VSADVVSGITAAVIMIRRRDISTMLLGREGKEFAENSLDYKSCAAALHDSSSPWLQRSERR
jgi:hypothetical protein